MKFDTKKSTSCTPFLNAPPNVFLRKNSSIPSNRLDTASPDNHHQDEQNGGRGRALHYEATIVHTPVLVSSRVVATHERDMKSPGLLSPKNVDELNRLFDTLSMNDRLKPVKLVNEFGASTPCESVEYKGQVKTQCEETKKIEKEEILGRVNSCFFDAKTNTIITVKRSSRNLQATAGMKKLTHI